MRRKPYVPDENKSVAAMRNSALEFLVAQYMDAQRYTAELKRAIASLRGTLPPDSPYRYVGKSVTTAVFSYLERVQTPQTIEQLIAELEAGRRVMGVTKGAEEIVMKSVRSNMKLGRLVWMDRKETLVGLPQWSGNPAMKAAGNVRRKEPLKQRAT
ncbi:MAG TPA: hypothetical protein VNW97_20185 [Candidatus Saccharimonadales bacterium]|jgi:hypothetical protein|nr:hypothetical protein [Candidatus Saccharimonadales bacterium]